MWEEPARPSVNPISPRRLRLPPPTRVRSSCAGHRCNRPLIDKDTDSQAALTWVAATPSVANGVRTVSRTLEGQRGYGCARAMAARSNVVVDADVCAQDATVTTGQASTLVTMVMDNVER
jgi:PknH-like extracellular domain